MSNAKSFRVTEEEYKQIQRMKGLTEENKQKNRLDTIKNNNLMIKHIGRAIEYKRSQIDKKASLEKEDKIIDGKKPIYMLTNECEQIEAHIEQLKEVNEATQAEYDNSK